MLTLVAVYRAYLALYEQFIPLLVALNVEVCRAVMLLAKPIAYGDTLKLHGVASRLARNLHRVGLISRSSNRPRATSV